MPQNFSLSSPIDCKASTNDAPPIVKLNIFSKIIITFEPIMQIQNPSGFTMYLSCATKYTPNSELGYEALQDLSHI